MTLSTFLQLLFNLIQSLRLKFREEGRDYFKNKGVFLKVYESYDVAKHEQDTMASISEAHPSTFRVPKIFKLIRNATTGRTIAIMEQIESATLELFIYRFLLFGHASGINIFYRLGRAMRELHNTNLDAPWNNNVPHSKRDLSNKLKKLVKRLHHLELIDSKFLSFIEKEQNIDSRLMQVVSLYGEAYFSHIMISNGKFIFLDMEDASHGPLYYDLATFSVSIYASVFIPKQVISKLVTLRNAFLYGYFGKNVPLESIRMAELYVLLHEIDKLCTNPTNFAETFRRRFFRALKIRRYRWLINHFILRNA